MIERRLLCLVFVVAAVSGPISRAARGDSKLCGIEATYGAVAALGIDPKLPFENLVSRKYVSHLGGSTSEDLCKAARALGADAVYLRGLGAASLENSSQPIILHVASDGQLEGVNHWALYLGKKNGYARIVNSGGVIELYPVDRVLARWDGSAVVVGRQGSDMKRRFVRAESQAFFSIIAIAIAAGFAANRVTTCCYSPVARTVLMGATTSCAVAVAVIAAVRIPLPFPGQDAVHYILAATGDTPATTIDLEKFKSRLKDRQSLIVDCRKRESFAHGSVPGSVNVPVDLTTAELSTQIASTPTSHKAVIFCQSAGCSYSKIMAVRLRGLGFDDLEIFPGGYQEWQKDVGY